MDEVREQKRDNAIMCNSVWVRAHHSIEKQFIYFVYLFFSFNLIPHFLFYRPTDFDFKLVFIAIPVSLKSVLCLVLFLTLLTSAEVDLTRWRRLVHRRRAASFIKGTSSDPLVHVLPPPASIRIHHGSSHPFLRA